MEKREALQYSPVALAFMGDAVYEQKAREKIILSGNRPANELHKIAVTRVCAEYQSAAAVRLVENGLLTDEEQAVLKRGRNAHGIQIPKHSTASQYRMATGLESLFGYLFLIGEKERIDELFEICWETEENQI
ncbi:MAG: Mini-ribonuclease 3 [Oscillospiraceae bacterium]